MNIAITLAIVWLVGLPVAMWCLYAMSFMIELKPTNRLRRIGNYFLYDGGGETLGTTVFYIQGWPLTWIIQLAWTEAERDRRCGPLKDGKHGWGRYGGEQQTGFVGHI